MKPPSDQGLELESSWVGEYTGAGGVEHPERCDSPECPLVPHSLHLFPTAAVSFTIK
jgi:hypothetical protein